MPEIAIRDALREAIDEEMSANERVFLMGEDIGAYGGSYAVTKGLLEKYGPDRIIDTPIAELGFVGVGIGAAMAGLRPMVEMMTINFSLLALDQIINNASKVHYMSGGQVSVPMVIRMASGAGASSRPSTRTASSAGTPTSPASRSSCPSNAYDAKGLLKTAFEDENPVIFIEHTAIYGMRGEVPGGGVLHPLRQGKDRTRGQGHHARQLLGRRRSDSLRAAEQLAKEGIDCRGHRPAHPAPARHRDRNRVRKEDEPLRCRRGLLEVRRLRGRDHRPGTGEGVRLPGRADGPRSRRRRADALRGQPRDGAAMVDENEVIEAVRQSSRGANEWQLAKS